MFSPISLNLFRLTAALIAAGACTFFALLPTGHAPAGIDLDVASAKPFDSMPLNKNRIPGQGIGLKAMNARNNIYVVGAKSRGLKTLKCDSNGKVHSIIPLKRQHGRAL